MKMRMNATAGSGGFINNKKAAKIPKLRNPRTNNAISSSSVARLNPHQNSAIPIKEKIRIKKRVNRAGFNIMKSSIGSPPDVRLSHRE